MRIKNAPFLDQPFIQNMRLLKIVLLSIFVLALSQNIQAQSFLAGKDISTVKVDALTDAEIAQIQQQ